MIKDEKNNLIIIDSLGNANNATNQRSKFLSIFKQYKDLISILILVIGAFNAIMAQLLCYLQRRARADYYKINEDYLDDNSLSFWFLFTILIIGVVLALYLICFYALFISKTKRRYFITALIHIVLLYSIEAYFIYWKQSYGEAFAVLILFFFLYFLIYLYVYLLNYKKINEWQLERYIEKNKKLTDGKNQKKKLRVIKKINKYFKTTNNIHSKINRKMVIAALVLEFVFFLSIVFYLVYKVGSSIAINECTYSIIAKSNINTFNSNKNYQVIISESSDYIYTFECEIIENGNESNLIIYNDILTSIKKPDKFTQVRYTFDSVDLKSRFS